jgi:hypothetical protein
LFNNSPEWRTHEVGNFTFHPLICKDSFYPRRGCILDVSVLSHDPYGSVFGSGDLDNRLKTLFDALCLPNAEQIPDNDKPQEGEDPFWVLLSDDRLITDFHFVQEMLLTDPPQESKHYIELTIKVTVKIQDVA